MKLPIYVFKVADQQNLGFNLFSYSICLWGKKGFLSAQPQNRMLCLSLEVTCEALNIQNLILI